ncbi:hypothetical protein NDN08_006038 [Rhodosorus marinus]|uniref:L-dopachrome isomerase n=1 Tax=Rhodosorus marinus TaxID=101924 RepID=A0AAV8UJK3_9RHOD|nr:hypothetical protein NDN08_006038 [Rhodosorus marinus]
MPSLNISTNVSLPKDVEVKVMLEASRIISEELGKPMSYITVSYQTVSMIWNGTGDPCAQMRLSSLGLPVEANSGISNRIAALLDEHCGIPPNRYCT